MDHLKEAKRRAERAECVDGVEWAQLSATLAIAHALITQAEDNRTLIALIEQLLKRLSPPTEAKTEQEENRDYNEYR